MSYFKVTSAQLAAADNVDMKRFGPPDAEFGIWCQLAAWSTEEVTALSIGRSPHAISLAIIRQANLILHPSRVSTVADLMRFSRIALIYIERQQQLLRAARHGELPATPVGDDFEIKPHDFLDWFERQRGQYPWHLLPDAMTAQFPPRRTGALQKTEDTVPATAIATPADETAFEAWLISEFDKPADKRRGKTQPEYMVIAKHEYSLGTRQFNRCWKRVKKTSKNKAFSRGRPRKIAV